MWRICWCNCGDDSESDDSFVRETMFQNDIVVNVVTSVPLDNEEPVINNTGGSFNIKNSNIEQILYPHQRRNFHESIQRELGKATGKARSPSSLNIEQNLKEQFVKKTISEEPKLLLYNIANTKPFSYKQPSQPQNIDYTLLNKLIDINSVNDFLYSHNVILDNTFVIESDYVKFELLATPLNAYSVKEIGETLKTLILNDRNGLNSSLDVNKHNYLDLSDSNVSDDESEEWTPVPKRKKPKQEKETANLLSKSVTYHTSNVQLRKRVRETKNPLVATKHDKSIINKYLQKTQNAFMARINPDQSTKYLNLKSIELIESEIMIDKCIILDKKNWHSIVSVMRKQFCLLCNTRTGAVDEHIITERHLENLVMKSQTFLSIHGYNLINENTYWKGRYVCSICNVPINSIEKLTSHLRTAGHQMKVKSGKDTAQYFIECYSNHFVDIFVRDQIASTSNKPDNATKLISALYTNSKLAASASNKHDNTTNINSAVQSNIITPFTSSKPDISTNVTSAVQSNNKVTPFSSKSDISTNVTSAVQSNNKVTPFSSKSDISTNVTSAVQSNNKVTPFSSKSDISTNVTSAVQSNNKVTPFSSKSDISTNVTSAVQSNNKVTPFSSKSDISTNVTSAVQSNNKVTPFSSKSDISTNVTSAVQSNNKVTPFSSKSDISTNVTSAVQSNNKVTPFSSKSDISTNVTSAVQSNNKVTPFTSSKPEITTHVTSAVQSNNKVTPTSNKLDNTTNINSASQSSDLKIEPCETKNPVTLSTFAQSLKVDGKGQFINDVIKIKCSGYLLNKYIKVTVREFHMVTGPKRSMFCHACKIPFTKSVLYLHCADSIHLSNLAEFKFIKKYKYNLVRKVAEDSYHCSLCNSLHNSIDLKKHLLEESHQAKFNRDRNSAVRVLGMMQRMPQC